MGSATSKGEKTEALRLCRERKRFIKQAIDSRYALSAAHVAYTQSLRNTGTALRRFAEAEVLIESTSATELDKTPSHYSYPSPSPSHMVDTSDSPLQNGSPLSPSMARLSYMRSGGGATALTVTVNPSSSNGYVEDNESMAFTMPPRPPPPPGSGSSWDFFDPSDDPESFRFVNHNGVHLNCDDFSDYGQFNGKEEVTLDGNNELNESEHKLCKNSSSASIGQSMAKNSNTVNRIDGEVKEVKYINGRVNESAENSGAKRDKAVVSKDVGAEREDPSEFITHRAKDFLSSIRDIENRFFRASESGKEVSRMLEANKVRVGYIEAKGSSNCLGAFQLVCCQRKNVLVSHEPSNHVTKVITWNRTTSSRSSSSRNPLAKDDNDDSGSDFIEEFCMIAGSHSSTLERLYAWERKLYDEVKESESLRKEYDQRCNQLRHQFAKDLSAQVIDKTRALAKDLHSRIRVALHAVDSISKRIEKMRDEELQPQLLELIQGSIRMWKAMLECHHAQYITISLAYHGKSSGAPHGDTQRQILTHLQHEIECFGLSFADWINSHTSYVEALNGWLQNCILQPRERTKGRRAFSPRRVLAPPIFVICRDWLAGVKALPSDELSDAIKGLLLDLNHSIRQRAEEQQRKENTPDQSNNEESDAKVEDKNDEGSSNLSSIHASLTKVLDRLTKFSEASLKMYEDIRQKSETARKAYSDYRPPLRL